jgi:hypothetical protein
MTESGSETTRPATWEDVKRVAALLDAHGVAWALVDGVRLRVLGIRGLLLTTEGARDRDRPRRDTHGTTTA